MSEEHVQSWDYITLQEGENYIGKVRVKIAPGWTVDFILVKIERSCGTFRSAYGTIEVDHDYLAFTGTWRETGYPDGLVEAVLDAANALRDEIECVVDVDAAVTRNTAREAILQRLTFSDREVLGL